MIGTDLSVEDEPQRNPLAAKIGQHIKTAREHARPKISQAKAAMRLGWTVSRYRSYELGDVLIGIDDLYRVAELYKLPITYFLGLPDAPPLSEDTRLLVTWFQGTPDPALRESDMIVVERNFRVSQKAQQATSRRARG